jgi:hypothetical protein
VRYRIVFIAGLAIGFVLGSRAGRERYEQLRAAARKVADSPAVQQAAGAIQAQAIDLAKVAKGKLADSAGSARAKVGQTLHDRVSGIRTRDANGHATGEAHDAFTPAPGSQGT